MMAWAGTSSTDSIISARYWRSSGRQGAKVTPQLPSTTDVMPCQHELVPIGSHDSWASRWVWMSTNPGVTSRPVASISRAPRSLTSPTIVMRSPSMATSARTGSAPDPSTTMPLRMTMSWLMSPPCAVSSVASRYSPRLRREFRGAWWLREARGVLGGVARDDCVGGGGRLHLGDDARELGGGNGARHLLA